MSTRVLVIEDNVQNMYLMKFLLEDQGFIVLQAMDGPAGVAMAKTDSPDMILLDIQLPGMNGYQVAEALTLWGGGCKAPIIAVTSYAMVGDKEKALASGCKGYIEKPINPDTFITEIKKYL